MATDRPAESICHSHGAASKSVLVTKRGAFL